MSSQHGLWLINTIIRVENRDMDSYCPPLGRSPNSNKGVFTINTRKDNWQSHTKGARLIVVFPSVVLVEWREYIVLDMVLLCVDGQWKDSSIATSHTPDKVLFVWRVWNIGVRARHGQTNEIRNVDLPPLSSSGRGSGCCLITSGCLQIESLFLKKIKTERTTVPNLLFKIWWGE